MYADILYRKTYNLVQDGDKVQATIVDWPENSKKSVW
jgi:hypothetical protein